MPGSEVVQPASTTTPPRSPIASPAARASWSRGPHAGGEDDDVGAASSVSSENSQRRARGRCGRHRARSSPCAVRTPMPRDSMSRRSVSPPPWSSCSAHEPAANSTTVRSTPRPAAPGGLEPEQAAADHHAAHGRRGRCARVVDPLAQALDVLDRAVDEAAREVEAVDREAAANEPVARTSVSHSYAAALGRTRRASRSMRATASPRTKRTRSSSSRIERSRVSSSGLAPAKNEVRPTRS